MSIQNTLRIKFWEDIRTSLAQYEVGYMTSFKDALFETFCKFNIAKRKAPYFTFNFYGIGVNIAPTIIQGISAQIFIDGVYIGNTSGAIKVDGLPLGTHVIQLK